MTGAGTPLWAARLLYGLVAVVGAAAGVTSLVALHHLAATSGWSWWLAWLLPVTVDAGAAAGAVAWLAVPGPARRFGRALTLALLAASIAGNGAGHLVAAAPWWLVAVVSAVPPLVLGAMVHLALLASAPPSGQRQEPGTASTDGGPARGRRSRAAVAAVENPEASPAAGADIPAAGRRTSDVPRRARDPAPPRSAPAA